MPEAFHCPNCNARLTYTPDMERVITCEYCGTSVVVPEHLIEEEKTEAATPQATQTTFTGTAVQIPSSSSSSGRGLGIVLALLIILAVGLVPVGLLLTGSDQLLGQINTSGEIGDEPLGGLSGEVEVADDDPVLLQIGTDEEGTGVGRFEDLRHVALDAEGNIYTAELRSERIQVFDAAGEFLTQWNLPTDAPIVAMDVARDGRVFIVQGSQIGVYDGGELVQTLSEPIRFDTVTLLPDGSILTADDDHLLRFDANNAITLNLPDALADRADTPELGPKLAATGTGDIVYLSNNNNALFIFNSEGVFQNRIEDEERLGATTDVVVDGSGNILVSAIFGVHVYTPQGQYVGTIQLERGPYLGLAVDSDDNLYIASRTKMVKIAIPDF